ncbi:MAG: ADP-heptose synthase [Candidatus Adlerbacteria bacterium]|nr:ADP-heptose synthase [Candidatus Adlerbacteria bacterium]
MKSVPRSAHALRKLLPPGKSFCLVGGVFDLIHVGHLHLLEYAATLENLLVVAVLSDNYVRGYKNSSRPIINQWQRAAMVAALRCVDYVYLAGVSPNSPRVLSLLKPGSIVFGENSGDEVRFQQRLAQVRASSPDTKIQILPRYTEEEISTGSIIRKIKGG